MTFTPSTYVNFVSEETATQERLFLQYLGSRDDFDIVIVGSGIGGGVLADDLADRMRVHFPTQTVATIATEDLPAVMPQDSVGGDPADDHVADRGPEVVAVGRRTQVPTE